MQVRVRGRWRGSHRPLNAVSRAEGVPPRQLQLIPEVHPGLKKEVEGGRGGREVGVCPGSQALGEGAEKLTICYTQSTGMRDCSTQTDRQYVRDNEVLF